MRDEEASAEARDVVRDVAQSVGDSREGEGAREGGWLGMLGRAREALGRFVSAAPWTDICLLETHSILSVPLRP